MIGDDTKIAVAGAGSIGCHAGGCLALAGRRVTLLCRPALADAVEKRGLRIVDLGGGVRDVPAGAIGTESHPAVALADAGVVLVTVKSRDTAAMAELVARHAPADTVVVSLQNGVRNAGALRRALPATMTVVTGMVPFNVVRGETEGAPMFHRASSGSTLLAAGVPGLRDWLNVAGFPVAEHDDIEAVLWGKLVMNLNNAFNALSGLPLAEQLGDRRWRRPFADQVSEALGVLRAAGIRPRAAAGPPPALIPLILRLPDWLFRILARRMLSIDPQARSSMWEDLQRGRPTEIDEFQGVIVELAERLGRQAPFSARIIQLVRDAESAGNGSPALKPAEIAAE
ncbi:2-dehydropantoate 2-reductase [Neoaquamicrobium sediminum]|uniref:2-dehydropantoate 2-reductase n=1 Tax=Neoaquamicrobium sediminum TaxID=1849104 RepID=UPI003BAA66C6